MLRKMAQDIQEEKVSELCTLIWRDQCLHAGVAIKDSGRQRWPVHRISKQSVYI